jgi:hypothetical protein
MKVKSHVAALLAGMLAASAWAQSAPQALNLTLPPESVTTESVSAAPIPGNDGNAAVDALDAKGASIPGTDSGQAALGVQYDDRNGRPLNPYATVMPPKCDDSTYNQPQIHGDVSVGVVGGNHVSGNYQTGAVNVSRAFGSCDKPTGGVSISIDVGQGNFNGHRQGWH